MTKKSFYGLSIVLLVLLIGFNVYPMEKQSDLVSFEFEPLEWSQSYADYIETSDSIVKGKIVGSKEKIMRTENVIYPVIVYELEIIEHLKSSKEDNMLLLRLSC